MCQNSWCKKNLSLRPRLSIPLVSDPDKEIIMAWSERLGKYRVMRVHIPCHPVTTQLCIFASTHNSLIYTLCWPQLRFDQPTPRSGSITTDSAAHCASWMPLCFPYEPAKYRKNSHSPAIHRRRCTDQSLQLLKLRPSRTVTDREAIIVTSEIPRDKFLKRGRFTCITLLVHQQLRNRFNKT